MPVELKSHILALIPQDADADSMRQIIEALSKAAQISKELRELAKNLINNPEALENLAKKYIAENPDQAKQEFIEAASSGKIEIFMALVSGGMDINTKSNKWGRTPLMHLAGLGHIETAKALISVGIDINTQSSASGRTALMSFLWFNLRKVEVIHMLINAGCDINIQDDTGATALMLAVWEGNLEAAKILLEKGADTSLVGRLRESPFAEMKALDLAKALRQKHMIELLTKYTNN